MTQEANRRSGQPDADADAIAERRAIFTECLSAHGIEKCVLMTGSFRAGTSFVSSLLGKNGFTGIRLERFAKYGQLSQEGREAAFREQLGKTFASARDGLFVAKIMWPHRNNLARCLGFDRADSAALAAMFPDAKWINVLRRDKVGQAISYWRAKQTDQWQLVKKDVAREDIEYDFGKIRQAFVELAAHDMLWQDFHDLAGTRVQHVVYEDFLMDVETGLTGLIDFLKEHRPTAGPIDFTSPLRKQRDELSARIRQHFMEDLYRTRF